MDTFSLIINTKENVIYVPQIKVSDANSLSKHKKYINFLEQNRLIMKHI
nr:hypothetical protein [Clostridium neonatale]